MPAQTRCPQCSFEFDAEAVLSAELESRLKAEFDKKLQQSQQSLQQEKERLAEEQRLFDDKRKRENEIFQQRLQQEKQKLASELQSSLSKQIADEYESRLKLLETADQEKEQKLQQAREKELAYLKKEQALKTRESEMELQLQKQLLEERERLAQQMQQDEQERLRLKEQEYQMRIKEKELMLEQQHKLIEEMKRRAEQSSMQRQGEVQELLLEELLRDHFPYDAIQEVSKGVEGADCIQTVRNHAGTDCGHIIFESKRAKNFSGAWVEKLKNDMRSTRADVAILVTQVYPKEMTCFGERDGVWICSFTEVVALTAALRHTIIRVAETRKSEENKGEKMQMLYSYLTGHEFRQQIENIVESFVAMKNSITKEKIQMEKTWKEREKLLEKVLLSTSGMYGSVKGIAGAGIGSIPLLDDEDDTLLLDSSKV